jgi:hypothetical protein
MKLHITIKPAEVQKRKRGGNKPLIIVFAGQCHQKELSKKPQSLVLTLFTALHIYSEAARDASS